jgi:formate hydrogenlyase subunit 3/multisubunit Na+/H+ antiporter MnhD subunit
LIVAKLFLRNRTYDWKVAAPIYIAFGVGFRAIGMYITNIFLIQWLYGMPQEGAIVLSATFIIPNVIQALINILIGVFIFIIIPESLAIQARFGKYGADEYENYEEISAEEIESTSDEWQTD